MTEYDGPVRTCVTFDATDQELYRKSRAAWQRKHDFLVDMLRKGVKEFDARRYYELNAECNFADNELRQFIANPTAFLAKVKPPAEAGMK